MTEPNYAEFDELHRTWLARPHLQLFAIISLARGITPKHWGEAHSSYYADCVALKGGITTGLLKAHRDDPNHMRYGNTVVYLFDLLEFFDKAGPEYEWLRKFAERWKRYCAWPGINVDGTKKPERPQYNTAQVSKSYREWISTLKVHPTMNQSDKWLSEHFHGFKRKTFRDEISRPLMPEECLRPGPRSTKTGFHSA
jgi:hypothetical protein